MASPDKTPLEQRLEESKANAAEGGAGSMHVSHAEMDALLSEVVRLRQHVEAAEQTIEDQHGQLVAEFERVERLREAIERAEYELHPDQGGQPDPVKASLWLRSTYPEDHPNFVASPDKPPAGGEEQ